MKIDWQTLRVRLRAASVLVVSVLVVLLSVWFSAPVALAYSSSNFCSMACCIEDGHCCCVPQESFVKGHSEDRKDRISDIAAITDCPKGCSPPQFSINSLLKVFHRKGSYRLELKHPPPIYSYADFPILDLLESLASSPRAPPAF